MQIWNKMAEKVEQSVRNGVVTLNMYSASNVKYSSGIAHMCTVSDIVASGGFINNRTAVSCFHVLCWQREVGRKTGKALRKSYGGLHGLFLRETFLLKKV